MLPALARLRRIGRTQARKNWGQRPVLTAAGAGWYAAADPMPRQARVTAAGLPHHVTHRGNNRQDVFLSDADRRRYQSFLLERLRPCGVELLGWCWMSNHVHLIAVPRRAESLARLVMQVHSRYAQDFNRRRPRT